MSNDALGFLMGSGGRSASFKNLGATISGTIVAEPTTQQQRDPKTQELKTWDDGNPMLQLVVKVQTDEREDGDDDGVRNVYVKSGMTATIRQAVQQALGAQASKRGLEVGGRLTVTYTGDGPQPSNRALNPPKLYSATYEAPAAPSAAFLGGDQQQPAQAPQPGFQQAVQQYQQAATQPPVQPQQQMQLGQQGGLPQIQPAPAQQVAPVAAPAQAVDPTELAMAKGMAGIPGVTDEQILAAAPSVASVLQAIRAGLI